MIKLIDGKGQIGTALVDLISKEEKHEDAIIYHTWDFLDKSEGVQKECYERFKRFVDENKDPKIVFTSTYSQTDNFYNYYKKLSESYLLKNNQKGYVIKLPTLIGKGTCQKFRDDEAEAFGEMELMTIEEAAKNILDFAQSKNHEQNRTLLVKGAIIPAKLVKSLILFGKNGK